MDGGTLNSNNSQASNIDRLNVFGATLDINSGTFNCGDAATQELNYLHLHSGTIDISGGTLNVPNAFYQQAGTLTQTGGTINLNTYSGTKAYNMAWDVANFDGGTVNFTGGTFNIYGMVGATVNTSYDAINIASGVTVSSDANHSLVIHDGADASDENVSVDFGGKTLGSLTISNDSYSVTSDNSFTVAGDLTVSSGTTLDIGSNNLTVTGATDIDGTVSISTATLDANNSFNATGGNVTFSGAGRLELSGTVSSLGTFTESTSTVEYDGTTQNVLAEDYYNLEIDGSDVKTAAGTVNVAGAMTVTSGSYAVGTTTTTVTGATDINGTLSISTGTYDANGTFDATGGSVTFTDAGTLNLGNSVTSLGALTNTAGTVVYDASNITTSTSTSATTDTFDESWTSGTATNSWTYDVNSGNAFFVQSDGWIAYVYSQTQAADAAAFSSAIALQEGDIISLSWRDVTHASYPENYAMKLWSTQDILTGTGYDLFSITGLQSNSWTNRTATQFTMPTGTTGNWYLMWHVTSTANQFFVGIDDVNLDVTRTTITTTTSPPPGALLDDYYNLEIANSNTAAGAINVDGNLTISSSNSLDMGSNALSVAGNITNNGTLTLTGNTTTLDGSSAQTISGSSVSFNNLTINSAGVSLSAPIDVSGTLTMTSGDITSQTDVNNSNSQSYAATNTITIKDGGSLSGASASSHVVGAIRRESSGTSILEFPTGDGTNYRPVFLTPADNTSTTYTAEFVNSAHSSITYDGNGNNITSVNSGVDHVAGGCWWDIEKSSSGANAFIGINWDANSGVDTPADMLLTHWNSSTSKWDNVTASATSGNGSSSASASDGRVTSSSAQSDFSPWNLGSSGSGNTLPIDLLSFHTDCSHDIVDVNFSVVSQVNNDYFLIERSTDAMEWEVVGQIEGAGNSNTQMDYMFTDSDPIANLSYYRLTQVDYDGTIKSFYPVSATCGSSEGGLPIDVYPNPAFNEITVELELDNFQGDDVYYTISDATGKIALSDYIRLDRGFNKHQLDVSKLPNGVYVLKFNQTKNHITETRIVKR